MGFEVSEQRAKRPVEYADGVPDEPEKADGEDRRDAQGAHGVTHVFEAVRAPGHPQRNPEKDEASQHGLDGNASTPPRIRGSTTRRSAFVQGRLIRSARRSAAENGVGVTDNFIGGWPFPGSVSDYSPLRSRSFSRTVPARAAARLHGLILGIDAAKGQVVVRHDPFDGMPGMTMPFALKDQAETAKVRVGNGIDVDVDETTEPWTRSRTSTSPASKM